MSSRKRQNLRNKLLDIERQRTRLLSDLLGMRAILRGSYAQVYTQCGKDGCWCKEGKGHPHSRITWHENGQGFTRKVPLDQIAWIREITDKYRTFRSQRRQLLRLEAQTKKLLDALENHLVQTTRSAKDFLKVCTPNRSKLAPRVPKKRNRRKEDLA